METTEEQRPTILQAGIFWAKTKVLLVRRAFQNKFVERVDFHPITNQLEEEEIIATSVSKLWTNTQKEELDLTAGKVQNLRIAIRAFDGIVVPPNTTLSFWKQLGKASKRKGYAAGRELREGCIVPSVGGGLCQLSNALYDAALKAGFTIKERHAHTALVPGSLAEQNRDATVFWNYVDLRFQAQHTFRIRAKMSATHLTIQIIGTRQYATTPQPKPTQKSAATHNCLTCNRGDCFRNQPTNAQDVRYGQTAFLVDDYWPELDTWMQGQAVPDRLLFVPINGKRWRKTGYQWNTTGFKTVKFATWITLRAAYNKRKATTPAERQRLMLARDKKLASYYANNLPYSVKHLVIAQNLLPHLKALGVLGGRTYTVLLTRTPLKALQSTLDRATLLHPTSVTLRDFRVDEQLIKNEEEALAFATDFITLHSKLARLFPNTTKQLQWELPEKRISKKATTGRNILFAGPSLARKGAYLLREAMQHIDAQLYVASPAKEHDQFWGAKQVLPLPPDWKEKMDVVVLPAYIEHQPRLLLAALAAGIPVIASKACGLNAMEGVTILNELNTSSLQKAILNHLPSSETELFSTPPAA